ncbi:hypothetical protein D9611_011436 [Ephemerocybe angulata]|uniref:RRM domain-containing protein n=1 Tax=Ephemerocybe angulata TaxID=980116 RepID=A0A8H5CDP3_9AGAR|nr:hypothetical protein D9611_011436 [Tulosesus angulatus]
MATSSNVTIEDLEELEVAPSPPAANASGSFNDHLSYPAPNTQLVPERYEPVEQPKKVLSTDRLYIGNLHPTVDEYAVLRAFSKFGKVTKLDFLFHKSGPLKGKPRGYAFIEYSRDEVSIIHPSQPGPPFSSSSLLMVLPPLCSHERMILKPLDVPIVITSADYILYLNSAGHVKNEAKKALTMAHDKLLRGRKIVVTYAQQAPLDQYGNTTGFSGSKYRKGSAEMNRPTAISLIKTGLNHRQEPKTSTKIAMMEAKLRDLEREKEAESKPSTSTLPHHHSLPMKPAGPLPGADSAPPTGPQHKKQAKPSTPLPMLPLAPPSSSTAKSTMGAKQSRESAPKVGRETRNKLAGVVIKPKARPKPKPTTPPPGEGAE